jgi:flagellin-like protein
VGNWSRIAKTKGEKSEMSEKSAARRERRLRYRRLRHNEKAVSPVVATLILILIAVAAAAALYLWLVGWQAGVTKGIGSPVITSNDRLSIGGSTTVYPLTQDAIAWFEANNTNASITDQQGGSVAGVEAFCQGQIEVAAASSSFTQAQLSGDGCSSAQVDSAVQTVVAVDAIVGIVSTHNSGIGTAANQVPVADVSFNATVYYAIYAAASNKVPTTNLGEFPGNGTSTGAYQFPSYVCGGTAPAGWSNEKTWVLGVASTLTYAACPVLGHATSLPWSNIAFPAACNPALVYASTAANASVGPTGCLWPLANHNAINTYDRLDSSGTEQGFSQKYLLIPKDGSSNSCGTDNQLESCNIIATHHEEGNPLLASSVAGDANGIGFNSYGQAAATSGLILAGYSNDIGASNALVSLTSSTTEGPVVFPSVTTVLVDGYRAANPSAAYGPWRVLEYVTNGVPPTGSLEASFINFVLGSEVNQNLASATGYISLYAA